MCAEKRVTAHCALQQASCAHMPLGWRRPSPPLTPLNTVYGEIEFECGHWGVFENAIDMAHIHYLHNDRCALFMCAPARAACGLLLCATRQLPVACCKHQTPWHHPADSAALRPGPSFPSFGNSSQPRIEKMTATRPSPYHVESSFRCGGGQQPAALRYRRHQGPARFAPGGCLGSSQTAAHAQTWPLSPLHPFPPGSTTSR